MKRIIIILFVIHCLSISVKAQWEPIGPYGGRVYCMSANDSIVYAMFGHNVYITTNSGYSWTTKFSDITTAYGDSPPYLLDIGNALFLFSGFGIYKSNNGGNNWQFRNYWNYTLNKMLYKDSALYICNGYIFKSTNDGYNWSILNGNLPQNYYLGDIIIAENNFYACGNNDIVKSTNNGDNWIYLNVPDTNFYYYMLCHSGNKIFIISYYNGIYKVDKTSNDGVSWTQCDNGLPNSVMFSNIISNKNALYITTYNYIETKVYKSIDEGNSWQAFNNGLDKIYGCNFITAGDYTIMGTNSLNGFYRTKPEDNQWTNSRYGMSGIPTNNLITTGPEIIASLWTGIYRSSNHGTNWTKLESFEYNPSQIFSIGTYPNHILISGADSSIYYSTNDGVSWVKANTPSNNRIEHLNSFYFQSPDLFTGTLGSGILKSTDNGKNWIFCNQGLNQKYIECIYGYKGILFAGASDGTYKSINNGNSWSIVFPNFPSRAFTDAGDRVLATNGTDLYYTDTFGAIWNKINSMGLEGFLKVVKNDIIPSSYLLGWSYGLLYISYDNGNNWSGINNQIPYTDINSINTDGQYLYLCTNSSIWRSSLMGTIYSITPRSYELSQNYPNPFNSVTKIRYTVPEVGNVKILVFDILGRKIKELVNANHSPGQYEITFDGSNLSSGIYFYQLQAGNFINTKKLVLLK